MPIYFLVIFVYFPPTITIIYVVKWVRFHISFNFEQILLYDMSNLIIFWFRTITIIIWHGIVAYWYLYSSDFSLLRLSAVQLSFSVLK